VAPAGWQLKFKLGVDGKDCVPLMHVFSDDSSSWGFKDLGPSKNVYHTLSLEILEAREFQEMTWSGSGVSWNLVLQTRGKTFRKGNALESPSFGASGVPDLKLRFYPRGDSSASEGKFSVFLVAPAGWQLKFKLGVDGKDCVPLMHVFSDDSSSFGFRDLGPSKNEYHTLSLEILEATRA